MKTTLKKCLAFVLAVVLAFGCGVSALAADSDPVTVQIQAKYGQTEARTMLDMINEFRTGDDAWYWNQDNETKTTLSDLSELKYDYTLEKAAMQRAAEIAIQFDHTRPDGTSCWTAYSEAGYTGWTMGENIAAGRTTAASTFAQWQETDRNYSGQGHRRNMLSKNYTAVGIGHVYYNGYHYWVQEFGTATDVGSTTANDATTAVDIQISPSAVTSVTMTADPDKLTLTLGESVSLPSVDTRLKLSDTWPGSAVSVQADVTWNISGKAVELSGDQLAAKQAGTATLTASLLGKTVSIPVTVTKASLNKATVTLDKTEYSYIGAPITPQVTVKQNGVTLKEGTDYTVSYKDNTEVGTASVIVSGQGGYTGSVTVNFTIVPCTHTWDNGKVTKEATCTIEGEMTYTCTVCGETKTEAIAKMAHTPEVIPAVPATCTKTGLTEGSRCSVCGEILVAQEETEKLPHQFEETIVKKPTCTKDGEKIQVCTVCGEHQDSVVIPAAGHSWDEGKVTKEPTCTAEGEKTFTCTVCNETKTEAIAKKAHTPEVIPAVPATCTKTGLTEGSRCSVCGEILKAQEETEKLPHQFEETIVKKPTCTEDGEKSQVCTVCGEHQNFVVIPTTGHSWDEGKVTKEPTCMAKGEKNVTCTICGAMEKQEIPAKGHTVVIDKGLDATCTKTGLTEGSHCADCLEVLKKQETIPAKGHSFKDGKCTACGEKDPNYKPASNSGKPNTGDNSMTILWAVLLILCGGTATVVLVSRKKSYR